jgi:hypothetical protein
MARRRDFAAPLSLPSATEAPIETDPVLDPPAPDPVIYFGGLFDHIIPPSNDFRPIWPADRPDERWTLRDLFIFVNELGENFYVPSQDHRWPTPNAHGFSLQVTIRESGAVSQCAIRVHFPPDLKNIQVEANAFFVTTQ